MKNTSNPNLPRSRNNPNDKRNNPQINWSNYNKGRKSEGNYYIGWMPEIANKVHETLSIPQGEYDWQISAILVSIVKSEEKLTYWGLVKHFEKHPGDLERCDLLRPYSKSTYQLRAYEIKTEGLQQIITWMAEDEVVNGTKIVDSSGFGISGYKDWHNAKYGKISVKDFVKLQAIHTHQGKISAATFTSGEVNDSPYLREMIKMILNGSSDLLGDSAYGGVENCNAVPDSGQRPIINPKSNAVPNGNDARAEMMRFCDKHPRTFCTLPYCA